MATYRCKSCGAIGSMVRRVDDEASTVKHRMELFQRETLPLVSFYGDRKNIKFVDGLQPPERVYVEVAAFLI